MLGDGRALAELRRLDGGPLSGRPGTENEQVVVVGRHEGSLPGKPFSPALGPLSGRTVTAWLTAIFRRRVWKTPVIRPRRTLLARKDLQVGRIRWNNAAIQVSMPGRSANAAGPRRAPVEKRWRRRNGDAWPAPTARCPRLSRRSRWLAMGVITTDRPARLRGAYMEDTKYEDSTRRLRCSDGGCSCIRWPGGCRHEYR